MLDLREKEVMQEKETLYGGFAITASVGELRNECEMPLDEYKMTIQRFVQDCERFGHAMKDYPPHITIARELPNEKLLQALQLLPLITPSFKLGELILLPAKKDYSLLAIEIYSPALEQLNQDIQIACDHSETFAFKPHITLDCIKTDKLPILECKLKNQRFPTWSEQRRFSASGYSLYDPQGIETIIHHYPMSDN